MNTFYKLLIALLVAVLCVKAADVHTEVPAYSQTGSSGTEVEEIQRVLNFSQAKSQAITVRRLHRR